MKRERTPIDTERYSRHLTLPEIGPEGQEKLSRAAVLVIGAGGLGSPVCLYLAAAGVGNLGLADHDLLDLSNLQRQVLYSTEDVLRPKVLAATERLRALNPSVSVRGYRVRFSGNDHEDLLRRYDFIVDATDNFDSKYAIAAACHRAGRPYSHAGIAAFFGQTMTVLPGVSACYRCVFRDPPPAGPAGPPAGPLGVVPGVIGSIQATEALKYILGCGELLTDRLLTYDALAMRFRSIPVRRDAACPVCGDAAKAT